jgi:group I intron endonuclease
MMLVFGDSSKRLGAEMPPFLYKYLCQTQSRTMKGVIYCYHCIATRKKYIGKTIHEERRKVRHKYDSKKGIENKFYRAVKKYGWDQFIYGIIEECDVNVLGEQEVFYIDYFDTYNNGYNSTLGGDGISGFSPSEESKKRMSESAKNRDKTPYIKYHTEEEKKEAKRKVNRKYHQRTKERRKEYMKEWRKNNQDKIEEWNTKNKNKLKEKSKEYRESNKEKIREYQKQYREKKKCDTRRTGTANEHSAQNPVFLKSQSNSSK